MLPLLVLVSCWPLLARAEPWTLEKLITAARSNDLRVKAAQGDLRVLRGKYEEARWAWFPRIESNLYLAGPTPEARNNGLGGPPTTEASYMYDLNFGQPGVMVGAEIQGVLPLYTFGKLDALEALAAKGLQVGQALKVKAEDEAEFQVAEAYWGLQAARGGKQSLIEALKRLDDAAATLKRLREAKSEQVTQMDVYKLEFFRKEIEARSTSAESAQHLALAALKLLSGAEGAGEIEVMEEELPELSGEPPPLDSFLQPAGHNRPELRAIDAGLGAREQEVLLRERMYFPDLGLAGFFRWRWTSNATRQLSPFAYDPYNDLSSGFFLVAKYTWDLPTKGAQLEQARGELEKLQHQREALKGVVSLEVRKAHGDLTEALARAGKQTEAEKAARRWATAAFTAFDVGTSDTRDMFESFTAWALSSAEKIQAWHDVQLSLHALSKAAGSRVELKRP